jgi:hypothetical protein
MVRRGRWLSNTWLTYPQDGDKPGKLGLIPDKRGCLEWFFTKRALEACFLTSPGDGAASDQVVGEVTAHQAYNRYGP